MALKTIIKTFLLAIPFIGVCHYPVDAQWSPIKGNGMGATDGCFSFSIGNKGYVGGGSNGNHFYEFDTTTNNWTSKGNVPGGLIRGFAFAFAANGKGYVGTGDTTGMNNACQDLWEYTPSTNTWAQKSNFPGGHRDGMFCFTINNVAYMGGGDSVTTIRNDFYKYDPSTDTWTPLPTLPFNILFPATFVLNGKGYVATGVGGVEYNALWQYDPVGGTWTQKKDFPGGARQTSFGFALGNNGYVGGGMSGYTTTFNDMWKYDAVADTWMTAPAYPSQFPAWTTAFTVGNNAYVGTGVYFGTSSLVGTDSFKKYKGPVTTSTGVNEMNTGHFTLYPNPATNYISIEGTTIATNAICTISDLTGKVVKEFSNITGNKLYIGDLQPGIYLFRYTSNTDAYTRQIIKRE